MKLLSLLLVFGLGVASAEKVVCYFGSWSVWRPGDGKFDVEDIDPFLCTHLIFGFAGLSNHTWTIEVLDEWNELCPGDQGGNNCAYDRFVALKQLNPELKTILAVGGWNEGSEDYSVMSGDPAKRKTFVDSSVALVRKHKFDGLDMDWEYPAARGGVPEDKDNFIILLQELRAAFDAFSPPLMLTGAVAAGKPTLDAAYHVAQMGELFDQVHLMTYDYHGAWENTTHHNAPLCGLPTDSDDMAFFNVVFSVNYYISLGVPKEKLVMGIPEYGRCYTLDNINENGMLSPASKPGPAGPYIRIPGTLGFNEICKRFIEDDTCHLEKDPIMYEPYFYCSSDNIWCGFDDADSVTLKARYAKNMGLSGILVWTVDTDDFLPRCYNEDFHLLRSMKRALEQPADGFLPDCQALYTTPSPSTTPEPTPSTAAPTPSTAAPTPSTAAPTPSTAAPTPSTAEPTPSTAVPTPSTAAPTPSTAEPTPSTAAPTPSTAAPTPSTAAPTPSTAEPTPSTAAPTPSTAAPTPSTAAPTPSTQKPSTVTPGTGHPKPDCSQHIDGSVFPHEDCNKYWLCTNGQTILEMCSPGTLFDEDLMICNWENSVDTSNCNLWICEVDNTYYPHADCNKYYWCYNGSPHVQECPSGLFWNQYLTICDDPTHVDTSNCNMFPFF
ncbi:chitinase-3-like protein 1 [Penaeus japonicus]|uniref:chitinase-3-like protein 1 n=1 Tax=Penaeus japonicus TaxID=27405 RepID=UPI001C710D5A|nr:chitinase-3-like protein 1 [Penaeus japonicus]